MHHRYIGLKGSQNSRKCYDVGTMLTGWGLLGVRGKIVTVRCAGSDLLDDDAAVDTGIACDELQRVGERPLDDVSSHTLLVVVEGQLRHTQTRASAFVVSRVVGNIWSQSSEYKK